MQEGIQRGALKVDKGLNSKKYLLAVLTFLIVAIVGMLAWSHWSADTGRPNPHDKGLAGDGVTATQKGGPGR